MFTYWLPWPVKRKATLPAAGPLPRKTPWAWKAFQVAGASVASAFCAFFSRSTSSLLVPVVDGDPLAAPRGPPGPAPPPAARWPSWASSSRASTFFLSPSTDRRADHGDVRAGAAWPAEARRPAPPVAKGAADRDLRRAVLLREGARHVLLEDDVEVRPAEAVGGHPAAPWRAVAPASTRRSSWFAAKGARGEVDARVGLLARSASAAAPSRGRRRPP